MHSVYSSVAILTIYMLQLSGIYYNSLVVSVSYYTHYFCPFIAVLGDVSISELIMYREVSDLSGPNPQFTLTCISTGGPATTVTWTRDSEPATGEMQSVLDNPMTAQYTHTLTVTGGQEYKGIYTCDVSNNKPSSASASYTIYIHTRYPFILYYISCCKLCC